MFLPGAGLKELAALKQLEVLDLGENRLTNADLKELAPLTQLKLLNLGGFDRGRHH
jgi:hypothetical protein